MNDKLKEALKAVMQELKTYHPHVKIIVDSESAELVEGLEVIKKE